MAYPTFTVDPATREEVLTKTDKLINVETAYKWAQRAVVAYVQFGKVGQIEWLLRAEDYRHEALEHAALVGDGGELTNLLESSMDSVRPKYHGDL
jgi:hypothetical protein